MHIDEIIAALAANDLGKLAHCLRTMMKEQTFSSGP